MFAGIRRFRAELSAGPLTGVNLASWKIRATSWPSFHHVNHSSDNEAMRLMAEDYASNLKIEQTRRRKSTHNRDPVFFHQNPPLKAPCFLSLKVLATNLWTDEPNRLFVDFSESFDSSCTFFPKPPSIDQL